jgi:hypothetical protein
MESSCGTLIIDDFDSLNDEQKTDVLQHYKTGYKATSKSIRQNTDTKTRKAEGFRNYGHVVMNNTLGIDDVSADRSVYLPIMKVSGDITTRNIEEQNADWESIREGLFSCSLNFWREVKDTYELLTSEVFSGREWEITRAVLTIAELISLELRTRLEAWLKEQFSDHSVFDLESEWDFIAFSWFFSFDEGQDIGLSEMAEHVAQKSGVSMVDDDKYKRKVHGIKVFLGKVFGKTPLIKTKHPKNKAFVSCSSHEKLKQYFEVKKWPLPE